MNEEDETLPKEDKKGKKKQKKVSPLEKKLVKELTKKISKELDKKMDAVLKQIRKETRKALREVLEEMRREPDAGIFRSTREALLQKQGGAIYRDQDFGAEEIPVEIEPDELHMGDDLQIVEVGDTEKESPTPKRSSKSTKPTPAKTAKQAGKSPQGSPAATPEKKRRVP
jgi:hypothetical protein